MMYKMFDPGSEIPLWCDGKSYSKKRSSDESQEAAAPLSNREKKEDNISLELQDKHANKFSGPQYKLWARLIENGQWDNMERPPNMPIFGITQPKSCIRNSNLQRKLLQMQLWLLLNIFTVHRTPIPVIQELIPVLILVSLQEKKLSFGMSILVSSRTSRNSGMMKP